MGSGIQEDREMMAEEIIRRVGDGETVEISTSAVLSFMQECERRSICCRLYISVNGRVCSISKSPDGNGRK